MFDCLANFLLCEGSSPLILSLCSESQSISIQNLCQEFQVSKSAEFSWKLRKFRIFLRKFRTLNFSKSYSAYPFVPYLSKTFFSTASASNTPISPSQASLPPNPNSKTQIFGSSTNPQKFGFKWLKVHPLHLHCIP